MLPLWELSKGLFCWNSQNFTRSYEELFLASLSTNLAGGLYMSLSSRLNIVVNDFPNWEAVFQETRLCLLCNRLVLPSYRASH